MGERRRKHWGWGYEDEQPGPDELRAAAAGLADHLGFGEREPEPPVALADVELPPPRLETPYAQDTWSRAAHAQGRSYLDVVRGRRGEFPHPPDGVAFPASEDELRAVLDWCGERDVAVVPFGGGTSVVGGVDAIPGPGHAGVVTVNLRALDRVLEVDPVSRAARIQAGATGPGLEAQLGEHGQTLRFYPQSFELATLGGWIATRAGGHFATGPTHIDDLVESVRALTAGGRRVGVAAAARLRRGPVARPHAARLGGHARGHHRGVGAGAPAARAAPLGDRVVPRLRAPASTRCARSCRRAWRPPTAACSSPRRRG